MLERLLVYAGLACLLCKFLTKRWPWELMGWELPGTSGRSRAEAQARTLLGVRPDARRSDILEAHKRLVAIVHPDRGGTNEQVHEANAARDLLLKACADQPTDS
ncbi:molecular chaperone DnaJ [Novosphingobium flavum]|uniref:Molecular chaperone DnaJ n=1 Tax=Novosphingobium flavum TaxID=1778672 RepID=A0A7X1FQR0_9SPHN|nr:molecular chaperone DnaJ [Novosphingobium flavum]MBC2664672.1 molecular chaperone DnaJ [Novosphingobium flavum]